MRWLNPPYIIGQFCQIHFYLPHYYHIEFFLIFSVIRAEHHPHGRICTGFKQTGYAAEQIQMIRFMRRHRSIITQCDRSRDSVASLVSKPGLPGCVRESYQWDYSNLRSSVPCKMLYNRHSKLNSRLCASPVL